MYFKTNLPFAMDVSDVQTIPQSPVQLQVPSEQ